MLAALAVVLRDDHVLLVKRANEPNAGFWGFPGGHVEFGETVREAAVRELREETGVSATPVEHLTVIDLIVGDRQDSVRAHYLLVAILCRHERGSPRAGDDATDARWVPVSDVRDGALEMNDRVRDCVELALERSGGAG